MPYTRPVFVIAAALLASACASTGEKPPEPTELQRIESPVADARTVWSRGTGGGFAEEPAGFQIAVGGGTVYVANHDGRVRAFSLDEGKRLWQQDLDIELASGPGLVGDLIIVGTREAEVLALDARDGSQRWQARLSGEVLAPAAGAEGVVVVRSFDGFVYGLDADGGQRLWAVDRTVPTLTLRGISAPLIVEGRVLVGTDGGKLLAVGLHDGVPVWESTVSVPSGRSELERLVDVDAPPVTDGLNVYAVSFGGDLAAFELGEGRTQWRQDVASITGIALLGDRLFVTDPDCRVVAVDSRNGDILWTREELLHRNCTRPEVHRGLVAIGDLEGYVHWLAPEDGSILLRDRPVSNPMAPPLAVGDKLLLLSVEGKLAAVELTDN